MRNAGKTTALRMLSGFMEPSAGTALVAGLDTCTHMDEVYAVMGNCPQFDLLWDELTGEGLA